MVNVHSPPGWLNIFELLNKVSLKNFQQEISLQHYIFKEESSPDLIVHTPYTQYNIIDCPSLKDIEHIYEKNQYPSKLNLLIIMLRIYREEAKNHEIIEKHESVLEIKEVRGVLFYGKLFFAMKTARDLLSASQLQSYILHHYEYKKIPREFWHEDRNWYRLLAQGSLAGVIQSIREGCPISGVVYFKQEEVESFLRSNFSSSLQEQRDKGVKQNHTLINLDIYSTPWLVVLEEIYKKFGKEDLARVSKDCIEKHIQTYIHERKLDIADSDISYLAKFMRLAEQKQGKAYQAKNKKASTDTAF